MADLYHKIKPLRGGNIDITEYSEKKRSVTSILRGHKIKPLRANNILYMYTYNRDDPVFEAHRLRDNRQIFRKIVRGLKVMNIEAEDGFKFLVLREQLGIIKRREEQAELVLRHGSFYEDEMEKYREKVKQRVVETYKPYTKWSRAKKII